MTDILNKIIERKKQESAHLKEFGFEKENLHRNEGQNLYTRLHSSSVMGVIAEIKRASPSKGDIVTVVEPALQAKIYETSGAAAISVLTDEQFFKGSIDDLKKVRREVNLPLLCKDFFIDEIQIDRAKDAGADIILLIVAALPQERLKELYEYALSQNLEVLVEVHDEEEAERAKELDAKMIGINNRDLKTFDVDLANTERLAPLLNDKNRVIISESGIKERSDSARAVKAGADGVLVGEALMRSNDAGKAIVAFAVNKEGALLG
ncbi:indole-3-glycerol phosphate synthase TrpC [Rossellomorea aquimaris]|uniref:indole-3-glycerol phosphate synthase TrpC n=1 Tax=Rossellomorea TaxID=2837508 RepID=UPI001653976B|nr:indole-3-glycerol phosphate synthase TrpC [Rossellomorea vietnamensis]